MSTGKAIAYVRVSTIEQNEARQLAALEPHSIDKWFTEKVSGKNTQREQLATMLDYIREGDTLYIADFSRLSRSVGDLLSIMSQLEAKGVRLVSLKENTDTHTATGKLFVTIVAAINQFERENMLERQREGVAIAKAKGAYKGRQAVQRPPEWPEVYSQYAQREISGNEAMKRLNLKRNKFYDFVNEERAN